MYLLALASILAAGASLCQAQTEETNTTATVTADPTYWCGNWAGTPDPANVPTSGQLPVGDHLKRFFVEPQLQRVPFAPIMASEPKVQVPKIWGNSTCEFFLLPTSSVGGSSSRRAKGANFTSVDSR